MLANSEDIQFIKYLNKEGLVSINQLIAKLEADKLNDTEKEQLINFLSDKLDDQGVDNDEINSLGERIDDVIGRIAYD